MNVASVNGAGASSWPNWPQWRYGGWEGRRVAVAQEIIAGVFAVVVVVESAIDTAASKPSMKFIRRDILQSRSCCLHDFYNKQIAGKVSGPREITVYHS